jgi:protein-tyrosine phosphatase
VPVKLSKAAFTSAGLSALFLGVYGGCNWFTSLRSDVGTLYFWWERYIPFVPMMVIPYMSIDLFFVGAPFLCRSERELATFAKRVTAAILVAGACFLLFPLRFAFARPHTGGWIGALFDWFRGMDMPYNLLPSLHIALRTFLGDTYSRHTSGFVRIASNAWFSLIAISTLLTYQHHTMDVVGGFALAGYCFYTFREFPIHLPVIGNRRVGSYYLIGAFALALVIALFRHWTYLLLWPAISFGIVASAYFGAGPGIFRKTNGRLPLSTWWTLGPCLLGQHLSLLYYRLQCRPWDEVTPGVWIGRRLNNREASAAVRAGVTAVLDLTSEFSEAKAFRATCYRNIPILDLTAPSQKQLQEMAAFIREQSEKGIVYVHCKIGYSRSAAAVGSFLLASGTCGGAAEAVVLLRRVRPSIVIRPEALSALIHFEQALPQNQNVLLYGVKTGAVKTATQTSER